MPVVTPEKRRMEFARRLGVRGRIQNMFRLVRKLPINASQRQLREPLRRRRVEPASLSPRERRVGVRAQDCRPTE
jgi:hypothetical protein